MAEANKLPEESTSTLLTRFGLLDEPMALLVEELAAGQLNFKTLRESGLLNNTNITERQTD